VSGFTTPDYQPASPPNYAHLRSAFEPWVVNGGAPPAPQTVERPWIANYYTRSPAEMHTITQEEFDRCIASTSAVSCLTFDCSIIIDCDISPASYPRGR
jgi:hypothetical protein